MDARFDLAESRLLLARTPRVLDALLRDLPDSWLDATEGGESWSPRIVLGHLVVGEGSDWVRRVRWILGPDADRPFPTFDRFAQFRRPRVEIGSDLAEFARARAANLEALDALHLTSDDLERTGVHPEFGKVTMGQHLATWTAHDLSHLAQIARVLARRWTVAVGPWREYLSLLRDPVASR